jgi:hypothetical protein
MRNTGLDGNGTFGTRTFAALEEDHPLRGPFHAQMLAAYLMREFSLDLAEHLARQLDPGAVRLDDELRRCLGLGNGSAFGLLFFVNLHPLLIDRWLTARFDAVDAARARVVAGGSAELQRWSELLERAAVFYDEDPFVYYSFTHPSIVAADLRSLTARIHTLAAAEDLPAGELVDRATAGASVDAVEIVHAMLLEVFPEQTDSFLSVGAVDETLRLHPEQSLAELLEVVRTEYAWTDRFDMDDPGQRVFRWYKSETAEEPRRGRTEEVSGGVEWALDLPGDVQRLTRRLEALPDDMTVGEFLLRHPDERSTVQRIHGLRGRLFHSPHMNMLGPDLVPAHVVRLMSSALHGLDKTSDLDGRWGLWGLIFHGAPTREDVAEGRAADWVYPRRPEQRG